jgi:hypothetical protein
VAQYVSSGAQKSLPRSSRYALPFLGDDRGYAIWLSHSDTKCRRGLHAWTVEHRKWNREKGTYAIVEDVDCELIHAKRIEERLDRDGKACAPLAPP